MKALTLFQPWATLIALGEKKIETRSWSTNYRGELAIHAGMNDQHVNYVSKNCVIDEEPFLSILRGHAILAPKNSMAENIQILGRLPSKIPFGCVVAICSLITCVPIERVRVCLESDVEYKQFSDDRFLWISYKEETLGDYSPGRFAWVLQNVYALPKPISAKGAQRLWEWKNE